MIEFGLLSSVLQFTFYKVATNALKYPVMNY